jgi:hypothetical protein
MVSWQTFVSIAFETAEQKGAEFENIADGGAFLSDLSMVWQADKEKYKQMTESQVRNVLDDLVEA